jgi:23S rRNA (cytidine2498-2'-O)-methyltransferase
VAALDKRLDGHPGLTFIRSDVKAFRPTDRVSYDALLCDMNGPPAESIEQVVRLSKHLDQRGIVVFTLKLPRVESVAAPLRLLDSIVEEAAAGGLRLFARTHLTYNRHEFTLFFERVA